MIVPQLAIAEPWDYPEPIPTPVDFAALVPKEKPTPPSVLCNCYAYIKHKYVPDLPSTNVILNNLKPEGKVAVFYYSKVGLYHYAYVVEDTPEGYLIDESNYKNCKQGFRVIDKNDPNLLGFFSV